MNVAVDISDQTILINDMSTPSCRGCDILTESLIYQRFVAEREEILRHKWIESEKAGFDIGYERAWFSWVIRYQAGWRKSWRSATCGL